mmetsp:Transcript_1841/g.4149  ORF Transcript_1841/g.4149 Transcript_1841/m.4149 type:complete len:238 (-) Transcript_1841:359-1072(-)
MLLGFTSPDDCRLLLLAGVVEVTPCRPLPGCFCSSSSFSLSSSASRMKAVARAADERGCAVRFRVGAVTVASWCSFFLTPPFLVAAEDAPLPWRASQAARAARTRFTPHALHRVFGPRGPSRHCGVLVAPHWLQHLPAVLGTPVLWALPLPLPLLLPLALPYTMSAKDEKGFVGLRERFDVFAFVLRSLLEPGVDFPPEESISIKAKGRRCFHKLTDQTRGPFRVLLLQTNSPGTIR